MSPHPRRCSRRIGPGPTNRHRLDLHAEALTWSTANTEGGIYLEWNLITTLRRTMPDDIFIVYAECAIAIASKSMTAVHR